MPLVGAQCLAADSMSKDSMSKEQMTAACTAEVKTKQNEMMKKDGMSK